MDYITFNVPTVGECVALAIALLLLVVSGFVSASEIAFFSLTASDLNELEESKRNGDKNILRLLADSERLLATILIANNFVNVTIVMLSNYFFLSVINFGAPWMEFLVITVVLTFLLLLFGEIMPKIYSRNNPLGFARRAASALLFFQRIFYPFATLLVHSTGITKKMVNKKNYSISVDDLGQALELTDKKEIQEQKKMLEGIIRFGDETVKEIMTPRTDMLMLSTADTYAHVLKCAADNAYSRIPVYSKNIDSIRGVLYIKDLLPHLNKPATFKWQSLVRPPYFIPETKKIDDLMREFQTNKIHIAIVVDEFGGTSGLVTLEDILEEIVGEINDEFDDTDKLYDRLNKNTYLFSGKTLLTDFFKSLSLDGEQFEEYTGEADTLAGWLLEMKGEFPRQHEKMSCGNLLFEVMEMDTHRIVKIKVTLRSDENAAADRADEKSEE